MKKRYPAGELEFKSLDADGKVHRYKQGGSPRSDVDNKSAPTYEELAETLDSIDVMHPGDMIRVLNEEFDKRAALHDAELYPRWPSSRWSPASKASPLRWIFWLT